MTTTATNPTPPTSPWRVYLGIALAVLALVFILVGGTLASIERRRLLGRTQAALETRDIAALEQIERELDAMFESRKDRLPPRRDGILNELGAARERVRDELARLRAGAAPVRSSSR